MNKEMAFTFPEKLEIVKQGLIAQKDLLQKVAEIYADAIENNGLIHVYANGHSKISAEENIIRMGALSGFHGLINTGLTTFSDVVGPNGIRTSQTTEMKEGLAAAILDEFDFGKKEHY